MQRDRKRGLRSRAKPTVSRTSPACTAQAAMAPRAVPASVLIRNHRGGRGLGTLPQLIDRAVSEDSYSEGAQLHERRSLGNEISLDRRSYSGISVLTEMREIEQSRLTGAVQTLILH